MLNMRRLQQLLLVTGLGGLSLAMVGSAADSEEDVTPASLDELKELIADVVEEESIPAVGIALVDASGPVWVDAIGKADIEADVDANADSMFRIGSTSKMFVSLAVLKLVEEGRLSLDERLSELAPDVEFENPWEHSNPIRIVHLLEHTTGWDDIHLPEFAHNVEPPITLKEGLDFHPHSRASRWQPGTRMSYCNAGPPVAAYVVQKLTGQDFEDYVRENFFGPMGMETMTYRLSDDFRQRGVTLYANGQQPQDYWHLLMRPSGAINASPKDLSRLLQFFVNRGRIGDRQLLSEESLWRMERVETTSAAGAGQELGYGLGNYSSSHKSWVYRAHNGGVLGGITDFAYLPKVGLGYAVTMNSDNFSGLGRIVELIRNFQTRDLEKPEVPANAPLTEGQRRIEGLYYPINTRQQVGHFLERVLGVHKLWFDGGMLQVKPVLGDEANVFVPVSATLYAADKSGALAVSAVEDPLAGPVVHVGTRVLKPVPAFVAYGQLAITALWGLVIVTSLAYFLVWGVRRLRKKIPAGPTIRIRLWPLLASASVVGVIVTFSVGMSDPLVRLGSPTVYSLTVMLLSMAFAVFAPLGVRSAVMLRQAPMNRWNYWYSTISSSIHLVVAAYLFWFGVTGLMTWS
jgi:CubicO group peptidase (beta-lactamase class C family)